MNKTILSAIGIICITIITLVLIVQEAEDVSIETSKGAEERYKDTVEDAYKNMYVEECNYLGTDYALCSCTWDYMENELGRQGLLDMANNLTDESPNPQVMIDAVIHCMEREI